jgi:hypothetical protein
VWVEYSWNMMAHGDAREGKWRGNWRMEWVASTLHTTSEHGVSSITTADAHSSAANNRLNWRPHRFKGTRLFRWKRKSGFCACAITFQTQSSNTSPEEMVSKCHWLLVDTVYNWQTLRSLVVKVEKPYLILANITWHMKNWS